MSTLPFNLDRLLAPVSAETFFAEYWEKKPLYIPRNDPSYYEGLVSLDRIDALISGGREHGLSLSLSIVDGNNGKAGVREYGGRAIDHDNVYSAFADGSTIRTRGMERHLDSGQQLTADLEKRTSAPVQINMYLTPRQSRGFNIHQDGHEVFILQATGHKHWKVYEEPLELPSDRVVRGRPALFDGAPRNRTIPIENITGRDFPTLFDITLRPGDFLYIPRGFYHNAYTSDALSMHLTVGVYVLTWHDALVHALSRLFAENPVFRRGLPPGFASDEVDAEDLLRQCEVAVQEMKTHLDADRIKKAVDLLGLRFIESRNSAFHGFLSDIDRLVQGVDLDEEVAIRPQVVYRLYTRGEHVHLIYNGRHIRLPSETESIVRYICQTDTFTTNSLPGDLSMEHKLSVVQQLLKHGFLTFVNQP